MQIVRSQTTLSDLRSYILNVLFAGQSAKPSFVFLSRDGGAIQPIQEAEILAWRETVEHNWTHHTFNVVIARRHIVIALKAEEITVWRAFLAVKRRL